MAMEGDWAARPVSVCACARDPANIKVKHTPPKSTAIASGAAVRAVFARRANGMRLPSKQSAGLTLSPSNLCH
jgi:hypothetical protein